MSSIHGLQPICLADWKERYGTVGKEPEPRPPLPVRRYCAFCNVATDDNLLVWVELGIVPFRQRIPL